MFHNQKNNLYVIKIEDTSSDTSSWSGWFGSFNAFDNTEPREFDTFIRDGFKYYTLPHNKDYAVRMINNSDLRVNAVLKIDGEIMGKWRINTFSEILIERPTHNNRKFTFVRDNSWQADMAGVKSGSSKNGLVEVTFIPEKRTFTFAKNNSYNDTFGDFDMINDMDGNMYDNRCEMKLGAKSQSYTSPLNNRESRSLSSFGLQSNNINNSNNSNNFNNFNNFSAGATVLGDDSSQRFTDASHINEDMDNTITKRVRLIVAEDRKPFVSIKKSAFDQDDPIPPPIDKFKRFGEHDRYNRDFAKKFDPEEEYARPRIGGPIFYEKPNRNNYQPNYRNNDDDFSRAVL